MEGEMTHQLTIDVMNEVTSGKLHGAYLLDRIDSIHRTWLEEKARELSKGDEASFEWYETRLGLTDSPKEQKVRVSHDTRCCYYDVSTGNGYAHTGPCMIPKEPVVGEKCLSGWICGYCKATWDDGTWLCCPSCTTPRPKKRELWEKLKEYFEIQSSMPRNFVEDNYWFGLAEIARKHFEVREWNKKT